MQCLLCQTCLVLTLMKMGSRHLSTSSKTSATPFQLARSILWMSVNKTRLLLLCNQMDSSFDLSAYVNQVNNEIFLSENNLNALYVMLLLKKPSQWDHICPSDPEAKQHLSLVLKKKVKDVDGVLLALLKVYEERVKTSHINWLEKFMSIIKAKNKSINYINRQENKDQEGESPGTQLFGVFRGISNISSLMGLGIGQFHEFNTSERYITFRMGQRYSLTIKNDDPLRKDTNSPVGRIPKEVMVHHILPFFNAYQLFGVRDVCKEWESHVKDAWHFTFKREMYSQLMVGEFCKEIEFCYKVLQMRNPFYQRLSILLHALIELIEWETLVQPIQDNSLSMSMKRILLVLLMLLGESLPFTSLESITESSWATHKHLLQNLKERVTSFFSNLTTTRLSILQLKTIKIHFLDNPFMRVDEIAENDRTPLLLFVFIKMFTVQSMIKNHILLTQEYLQQTKTKLDKLSSNWIFNKGFLEGAYRLLLMKSREVERNTTEEATEQSKSEEEGKSLDFSELLKSAMECHKEDYEEADFVIRNSNSTTSIYLDKRTKWDMILSAINSSRVGEEEQGEGEGEAEKPLDPMVQQSQVQGQESKEAPIEPQSSEHASIDPQTKQSN